MPPPPKQPHPDVLSLSRHMSALKLPFMLEHHQAYAQSAADKHWSHLDFVKQRGNVVFISGPGMGKSHLMTALGHAACQRGHSVLFTGAIEIINTLSTAHASGSIKRALHQSIKPAVLCVDELGYLPIDKFGADCLFQIISHRYLIVLLRRLRGANMNCFAMFGVGPSIAIFEAVLRTWQRAALGDQARSVRHGDPRRLGRRSPGCACRPTG